MIRSVLVLLIFAVATVGAAAGEIAQSGPVVGDQLGGRFEISITVDDFPDGVGEFGSTSRLQSVRNMIASFKAHGITDVYGFVNSDPVRANPYARKILKTWIDAGFKLGNHTASHRGAIELSAAEFIKDVELTDHFLEKLGVSKSERRVIRFPFLAEGETLEKRNAIREYLEKNGYTIAPVTVDTFDWLVQDKYQLARTRQGRERAITEGLKRSDAMLAEALTLSTQHFDRQVRHVALFHLADVHNKMLNQILDQYTRAGARFISLDQSLKDPAFGFDHGQASPRMGGYFVELGHALGNRGQDPERFSKFDRSEIQARIEEAKSFRKSCDNIFAVSGHARSE